MTDALLVGMAHNALLGPLREPICGAVLAQDWVCTLPGISRRFAYCAPEAPLQRLFLVASGAKRLGLIEYGEFVSHSGIVLPFKINCDALTDADVDGLAKIIRDRVGSFRFAYGIPRGGLRLAAALNRMTVEAGPVIVVDDVSTTGASIRQAMSYYSDPVGFVIFARGALPRGVHALFYHWSYPPLEMPLRRA